MDSRARREEVRRQYGDLFAGVSAVLFVADPIGINFGSNTDEYEPDRRHHHRHEKRAVEHAVETRRDGDIEHPDGQPRRQTDRCGQGQDEVEPTGDIPVHRHRPTAHPGASQRTANHHGTERSCEGSPAAWQNAIRASTIVCRSANGTAARIAAISARRRSVTSETTRRASGVS